MNTPIDGETKQVLLKGLNYAFADFTEMAFKNAGLSDEDSAKVAASFTDAFIKSLEAGESFEESCRAGLLMLNDKHPNLMNEVEYSSYKRDVLA